MLRRRTLALALPALTTLLLPATALAGGFEVGDNGARALGRGGAYVAGAKDLTAIQYNPALLAKLRGTRFQYSHNLVWHDTSYQRASLDENIWGFTQDFERVEESENMFPLGAMGMVSSDFGLDNWTFALGVYGPPSVGKQRYPDYGPQSFMLTEINVLLVYYSLAAAWQHKDKFGVGATLQYVNMPVMEYGLVVDSSPVVADDVSDFEPLPIPTGTGGSTQLTTVLEMNDWFSMTGIIGAWYRPHERVEVAVGGRVVPIFLQPKGGVRVDNETLVSDDVSVEMELTYPVQIRAGGRYVHPKGDRELFDVEANVVYESWRTIDEYATNFQGRINGLPIQDVNLTKNWKDTVSVRLGGDVNLLDDHLTLRLGGLFETGAVEDNYAHLDFPSFMRGGVSGGVTGSVRGIGITAGYMHVFQPDVTVTEANGRVYQQRPVSPCPANCSGTNGVVANAGTFSTAYDILGLSIDIDFNTLAGKKRKKSRQPEQEPAPSPAPSNALPPAGEVEAAPEPAPEPVEEPGPASGDPSTAEELPEESPPEGPVDPAAIDE